jgi:hypothetical protein
MLKNKKAVHPVVSVALLLVVAIVAAIGFQSWFNSFQASTLVSVEQNTNDQILSDIYVEDITTTKIFINSHSGSSTISNVEIISQNKVQMCDIANVVEVPKGISTIDVTSCSLVQGGVYEILILTNKQLIEYTKIAR